MSTPVQPIIMLAKERAKAGICDGDCERRSGKHIGKCRVVSVSEQGKSWGVFSYCEQAVADDRANSFNVVEWPA